MSTYCLKFLKSWVSGVILVTLIALGTFAVETFRTAQRNKLILPVRLMAMIMETGGGVMEVDDKTMDIIECTSQVEKIFGYESGELIGQNLDVVLPKWFRDQHHKSVEAYNAAGGIKMAMIRCRGLHRDGTEIDIVTSVFLNKQSGHVLALILPSAQVHFYDMIPAIILQRSTGGDVSVKAAAITPTNK